MTYFSKVFYVVVEQLLSEGKSEHDIIFNSVLTRHYSPAILQEAIGLTRLRMQRRTDRKINKLRHYVSTRLTDEYFNLLKQTKMKDSEVIRIAIVEYLNKSREKPTNEITQK